MPQPLQHWLEETRAPQPGRPLVTLAYAQSLDGCLTVRSGQPTALSGAQSRVMTHGLRAAHDAILVGIGTVLADNPKLNVRLAAGNHPRPVVLDTYLRIPDGCDLLQRERNLPVLAIGPEADPRRVEQLEARGVSVLRLPAAAGRVHLPDLLARLCDLGLRSLMVEGGARVITAFLADRLVDRAVVTIAPVFLGGLHASAAPLAAAAPCADGVHCVPALVEPRFLALGDDLVVYGRVLERGV